MGASKLADMVQPTEIARLKITLDDVEPAVVRRIEVPFRIRLDRLYAVLQAAVGWTNSHLWEFRAGDVGRGIPDPGWGDGPLNASKATFAAVLEDTGAKKLTYLYDFGVPVRLAPALVRQVWCAGFVRYSLPWAFGHVIALRPKQSLSQPCAAVVA